MEATATSLGSEVPGCMITWPVETLAPEAALEVPLVIVWKDEKFYTVITFLISVLLRFISNKKAYFLNDHPASFPPSLTVELFYWDD